MKLFLPKVFLATALASTTAFAKPLTFNATDSKLLLTTKKLGFSTIHVKFSTYKGTINYPKVNANMQLAVDIVAKDFSTGSSMQDKMFKGEDWLNIKKHPTISFVSNQVNFVSPTKATITGNMTIKNITKKVTFNADITKIEKNQKDTVTNLHLRAKGKIKRYDFGMTAMKGIVNNTVNIDLSIKAR